MFRRHIARCFAGSTARSVVLRRRYGLLTEALEPRRLLTTWYVDASSPGPAHNGSSWAAAYTDLQKAISAAASGDQIRVADGTYKPTSTATRALSFTLKNGVGLYGGYAGYSATNPDARDVSAYLTILSGDIGTAGSSADNSYHVVAAGSGTSATAVLDGFTVTAGNANGTNPYNFGGGIYITSGSPTVRNCTFLASSAADGGAAFVASSSATFAGCAFSANSASTGGAIYVASSSSVTFTDCSFTANSAYAPSGYGYGGAIYNNASTLTVTSSAFAGNTASSATGRGFGGAIADYFSTSSSVTNCTLTANSAYFGGGIYYNNTAPASVTNSILWANTATVGAPFDGGAPNVTYTDVQGGYAGTGNLNADPVFVRNPSPGADGTWGTADDDYGGLRLLPTSPCIDIGSNAAVPSSAIADLAGNPRITDIASVTNGPAGWVDLGAYELPVPPVLSFAQTSARAFENAGTYSVTLQLSNFTGASITVPVAVTGGTARTADYGVPAGITIAPGQTTASIPVTIVDDKLIEPAETLQLSLGTPDNAVLGSPATSTLTILDNDLLYVDAAATAGNGDGSSWANALTDLQQALAAASAGTTIRVAAGTYRPTTTADRTLSFTLKSGAALYGGYAGSANPANPDARSPSAYPSILSGDIGSPATSLDNSYHVVTGDFLAASTILDGFTITGGNANGTNTASYGGGLYLTDGLPTITNCSFVANAASSYGGGVYTTASPTLLNCTFVSNSATNGGGVYNGSSSTQITGCTFTANSALNGGGLNTTGSAAITNCTFDGNAGNEGGGVFTDVYASPAITDCAFVGNSAPFGGGLYVASFSVSPSAPTIVNCTFTANAASSSGGGIYNSSPSTRITNSILWGNTAPFASQVAGSPSDPAVTYSDIQGGYAGTGNVDADPRFLRTPTIGADSVWGTPDDDYGDLRLSPASPVVDTGSNAAIPPGVTTDLAGSARRADVPTTPDAGAGAAPVVDMGAYEATPALAASTGGPYVLFTGQTLTLAGRGASDVAGTLQYAWEWTGDGLFDDAAGPTPSFPMSSFAPGLVNVSLRVTDAAGHSTVAATTLRILPAVAYVDSRATGSGSGADWADAFTSLADALALALPGQTLRVATGTYLPTSTAYRTPSFTLKTGVALYGGYAGLGTPNPDARDLSATPSVLSGDVGTPGPNSDNTYHVVVASWVDSTAVLDGFTVAAGNANGSASATTVGGGLYVSYGSPTIRNCSFNANSAAGPSGSGGGAYLDHSSPSFTNCTFTGNSASGAYGLGGGICAEFGSPTLANCTFTGNSATSGGAIFNASASPTISGCTFRSNSATSNGGAIDNAPSSPAIIGCTFGNNSAANGGAIANETTSAPSITNCTFTANAATRRGGAIYNYGSSAPVTTGCTFSANSASNEGGAIFNQSSSPLSISGCTFTANSCAPSGFGGAISNSSSNVNIIACNFNGNTATTFGGAIYNGSSTTALTNCTFAGNSASGGGAIQNTSASHLSITNCTFAANSASGGGAIYDDASGPTITNSIFWASTAAYGTQIYVYTGTAPVTYTDVQGGYAGTGNLNTDPLFVRNPNVGKDGKWGTADDDYGDLRLRTYSPAIDAGSNAAVPAGITTDLAGNPRLIDVPTITDTGQGTAPVVDLGAYETIPTLSATTDGPYLVLQNQPPLVLHGYGCSDAAGPLQYAWEWTGDGLFDDATGPTPSFPISTFAPGLVNISLRVTDGAGRSTFSTTTMRIFPGVAYVDPRATAGTGSGADWANAFTSLADALALALPGQTLRVAAGTYRPTTTADRTLSFTLKSGVALYGGYAGFGTPHPDARDLAATPSVLSGDIGTPGDNTDNSYNVVVASRTDKTAVLDGFTISAGNANGTADPTDRGAGLYDLAGNPTIANCTFLANSAKSGGGAYSSSASPTFTNCTFASNSASNVGGGFYCYSGTPTFIDCTFTANTAASSGGAIYTYTSTMVIAGCVFIANSANLGGAIYNSSATPTIADCTFVANSASHYGGAIYNYSSFATIANSVFWANAALSYPSIYGFVGSTTVTYSDVPEGFSGTANISADPRFYRNPSPGSDATWGTPDDDYGDLRLLPGSPALDTGSNAAIAPSLTTDLAGRPRITDFPAAGPANTPVVDMGAYEASTDLGSLRLTAGQTVALPAGGYAFTAAQLTLAPGATLDLADDSLLIDYAGTSPLPSIRAALANGYSNGTWTGTGITSSVARATSSHAVGYAEAADLGLATFNGQPVDTTALLLKYTWAGDANLDGALTGDDFALLDRGRAKGLSTWVFGDFDYDAAVTDNDAHLLAAAYAAGEAPAPAPAPVATVEPSPVLSPELTATSSQDLAPGSPAAPSLARPASQLASRITKKKLPQSKPQPKAKPKKKTSTKSASHPAVTPAKHSKPAAKPKKAVEPLAARTAQMPFNTRAFISAG